MVGDLHGHRALLEAELDRLGFDPGCDRLFSVGDLIDRGPDSLATLSLIEQPWFHPVLGNHELAMLSFLGLCANKSPRKSYASGGSEWLNDALDRHRKKLLRLAEHVAQLPLSIHVDTEVPFNVMHSDLHAMADRSALFSREAVSLEEAESITLSRRNVAEALSLSMVRLRFAQHSIQITDTPMGELPITYVGHCPVPHVVAHNSYVHIDQGVCVQTKNAEARPPTVLDHAAFARWLKGASTARLATSALAAVEDMQAAIA